MQLVWWGLGSTLLLYMLYMVWSYYVHPARSLWRQAARMNWVVTNCLTDEDGHKDIYLLRDGIRTFISFKKGNVELIEPLNGAPFKNFIELESWLEKHTNISGNISQDPVWKSITTKIAGEIQAGFMKVYKNEKLQQYFSTKDISKAVIIKISEVANEVARQNTINPALVLLVIHQYIDSDSELREKHKDDWVMFMMSRPKIAPQPETYAKYINTTYFKGQYS